MHTQAVPNSWKKSEIRKIPLLLFLVLILSVWQWSKTKRKQTFLDVLSEALRKALSWQFLGTWTACPDPLETEAGDKVDDGNPWYLVILKEDNNLGKNSFLLFFLFSCPNYRCIISYILLRKKTNPKPNKNQNPKANNFQFDCLDILINFNAN